MENIRLQTMFDFVEAMTTETAPEGILTRLSDAAQNFGLSSVVIAGLPRKNESTSPNFFLTSWPLDWFERYVQKNYVLIDPVVYRTFQSDTPFVWSDVFDPKRLTRNSRKLLVEAKGFGLTDGLTVPLHCADGTQAIVSYSAEKIDLRQSDLGLLQLISIYAFNALRELNNSCADDDQMSLSLTARERECIRWCAEGKTSWEIGQILGRSDNTIKNIIISAQKKMNVVNRAQLIAQSFRYGIIR